MMLSEFYTRLSVPARGSETLEAYLRLPKARQDDLKDVGGFVGGELEGGVRKNRAVRGRDLITLDFDSVPAGGTEDMRRRAAGLGCGYAIYSTRKHEPARPRLRLVAPLDRTATADEYEPIARKLAEMIGIEWCDPTTFQAVRMMYWPSVCADGEYVFACEDKPFLSADGVLALYGDWRDVAAWPQVPGQKAQRALAGRQEDPTAKTGVVGLSAVSTTSRRRWSSSSPASTSWREKTATPSPVAARPAARWSTMAASSSTRITPPIRRAGVWSTASIWCGCTSTARWMTRPKRARPWPNCPATRR